MGRGCKAWGGDGWGWRGDVRQGEAVGERMYT